MIEKKIALGTANFGAPYGFFSKQVIKEEKIKEILLFCKKNNINTLETSPDYDNSEIILGRAGCEGFRIITKIPKLNNNYIGSPNSFMKNSVVKSLKNLNKKKLYALLFRDPKNLVKPKYISLWKLAKEYKSKGIIEKVGITTYDTEELEKTFDVLKPDIVQVPYNLFDKRIETTGWLNRLNKKKVEIHCRSIFLQGLLLKKEEELPLNFSKHNKAWKVYHSWLIENNLTSLEACINFILKKKEISKMIIGVENVLHLQNILMTKKRNITFPSWSDNINAELIDPRKW